jgi:hypothetical protein
VPITENLRAWLTPHRRPNGEVTPYANMSKQLMWLAEDVHDAWQKEIPPGKFTWKHNALRHSFISYRVAKIQNVAQVALEAGNSPRMVFSNRAIPFTQPPPSYRATAATPDVGGT